MADVRRILLVQPLEGARWRSINAYAGSLEAMLRSARFEVEVAEAPWFNPPSLLHGARARWAAAPAIRDAEAGKFDIVHLTDQALAHHLARFRRSASVVVTVHDLMPVTTPGYYLARREAVLKRAFLRRSMAAIGAADRVVAVSEFTKGELQRVLSVPERSISVVPNVVREAFAPCARSEAERLLSEVGVGLPTVPRIVSVGHDRAYKNLPALLRALAEPEMAGASLVRVGAPMNAGQVALAQELGVFSRVTQLGSLSDEQLAFVYAAGDVLAQPSFGEGFGIPVIEAMACGLPVVTSDGGALPEVVGEAGIVVPLAGAGFPGRFAAALAAAIENRERLSIDGLRRSEAFRPAAVLRLLVRAYEAT